MLATGATATVVGLAIAIRRLDAERIPHTAVLAAAFFVASLITVPVGPTSVHLLLNGLMGLILGWSAVPAILVALLLQAIFFGYGGLIVLGVNTFNLALPALLCAWLFQSLLYQKTGKRLFWLAASAGAFSATLTALLVSLSVALSDQAFMPAAKVIAATYLPLILAEAAVTGSAIGFLRKVAPELLQPGRHYA